jgi:hypothetical protein
VIPSTLEGETSPDVGGASPAAPKPAPARRESIASFSDVSKVTDPRLIMRRSRMRRVFMGVMAGCLGILALAGVCSLVRRPSQGPEASKASEPSAPAVNTVNSVNAAPMAEAPPLEPAATTIPASEPQVPLASAAATKTPLPRTHRPKTAPHKPRGVR